MKKNLYYGCNLIVMIELEKNNFYNFKKKLYFDFLNYFFSKCRNFILNKKPDWIINCAAYTKVDKAESERNLAYMINALSVKHLAEAMKEINGNFIQISTDYVFNGKKNIPYQPNDIKSPINIYGKTKSLAEDFLKDILIFIKLPHMRSIGEIYLKHAPRQINQLFCLLE